MLSIHPSAALEYWFFKVNEGSTALLVDWIARRRIDEQVLRVSIHSPQGREVLFGHYEALDRGDQILTTRRTAGHLGEVAWDLHLEVGPLRVRPHLFPAYQLQALDVSLETAPSVWFSGWIQHGSQRLQLERAPGLVSQYWGRQLMRDWWWLSANHFEPQGPVIEAAIAHSRLWGSPLTTRLGYFYLYDGAKSKLWFAPPARTRVSGTLDSFTMEFQPLGGPPYRLVGRGRDFGDFGEGITNTSVGDLDLYRGDELIGRASGSACLERREPPTASG